MSSKDEKNLAQVIDKIATRTSRGGRLNLAITEKADFRPAGGADGALMPAAWYFETVDEATERRIADIVRAALASTSRS